MAESPETGKKQDKTPEPESTELGILENYGTFPVWMLRMIQMVTPDFLISKTPPKKKDYRI